jgi:hypothetical protein
MELDEHDIKLLYRALNYHVGKLRRQKAKSTFTPEPGKGDRALRASSRRTQSHPSHHKAMGSLRLDDLLLR